jgi:hypothetical protein
MSAQGRYGGAALAAFWITVGLAPAQPLHVGDFDSLGPFPTAPGVYKVDTSGTPTLVTPDGTVIEGVVFEDIAVFTFDDILVGDGMTLTASGDRPLALLSYRDVTVGGTGLISVRGQSGVVGTAGLGGPGGGGGGAGGTAGNPGNPGSGPGGGGGGVTAGGGGGGFGGSGGGAFGGPSYGDLALALEGGSGDRRFGRHYHRRPGHPGPGWRGRRRI